MAGQGPCTCPAALCARTVPHVLAELSASEHGTVTDRPTSGHGDSEAGQAGQDLGPYAPRRRTQTLEP